ncbi:MAG: Zn-dependent hydrolase, partial [Planctomycetota bacterium]
MINSALRLANLFLLILVSNTIFGQTSSLPKYVPVKLTADLSRTSPDDRKMLQLFIEAADQMDRVFWKQSYGEKAELLDSINEENLKEHAKINYGPWERLQEDRPFIEGVDAKPKGANFYPADMTLEEFEAHLKNNPGDIKAFKSLYTVIRRDHDGGLIAIPYSQEYKTEFSIAAEKLKQAADLARDKGFKAYLNSRAEALLNDQYQPSDLLWMDMKSNRFDVVVGPIENYEDKLNGYKAAAECYVLVKDMKWSRRLSVYSKLLPVLQRKLPVEEKYKTEEPGSDSDLNAYDVVYYAGDCNAGSKTIAINLPNDEEVQLKKGSRRLQLKNAMR